WQGHLAETQRHILETAALLPRRRTVVVLGSGPLFDVPLEDLGRAFERVILVDRVHLFTARRRASRQANVSLKSLDLSAASNPLPLAFLGEIPELDWVVSLNLVSQLAFGAPAGREREVVDAHLDGLAALPCRVSLVTD